MRYHNIPTAVILVHFLAEITKDSKMVTWGSILVHTTLESSDRVSAGPCLILYVFEEV